MKLAFQESDGISAIVADQFTEDQQRHRFMACKYIDLRLAETDLSNDQRTDLLSQQFFAQQQSYQHQFQQSEILTIMAADQIAGQLWFQEYRRGTLIIDFSIMPKLRQKGIGARVMSRLQERNRLLGRHILCRVRHHNQIAHQFYRHCGFQPVIREEQHLLYEWLAFSL